MKKTRTRIWSILLSLTLVLSLLPVTALADETGDEPGTEDGIQAVQEESPALLTLTGDGTAADPYQVSTAEDLIEAFTKGGYMKLTENVSLTDTLTVPEDVEVALDLNGYDITCTWGATGTFSLIDNNGTLTITDNSGNQGGAVVLTAGESIYKYAYLQAVSNDGTFTLAGGTLKVTSNYACYPVGIRTCTAGSVTTIDGGDIRVEKTGSVSGSTYGIWADKIVDLDITLASGDITVENGSSTTYGIYVKGGSPSGEVLTLSGGSIDVAGTSSIYGVFLLYFGLDMSGTDVSVTGTSTAYGVYCSSANENRQVSGGSVTVDTSGAAYGLQGVSGSNMKVTDCTVNVSTTGSSNTYPCQYCDISGGSYTGKMLSYCTVTGGSYSFDPVGFYEPYVYQANENNGMWTVEPYSGTEAWVENLKTHETYASLTKAASEAGEGDTLQLQADIDLKGYAATIDNGLTLDLNGHKLYSSSSLTNALLISGGTADHPVKITDSQAGNHENAGTIAANQGIWIKGGNVVIEKINIESKTTALSKGITLKDYTGEGEVELLGVNIEVQGKYASYTDSVCAVYVNKVVQITMDDLNDSFPLTVSVENIATSDSGCAYAFFVGSGVPDIKIEGGTYSMTAQGEAAVIGANSNSYYADINGGYFKMTSTSGNASVGAYSKNAKVYGGYFNVDPSSSVADGCSATTENVPTGYTHTVKVLPVAKVGEIEYTTLQAAIDAAVPTNGTVTLIRNAVSGGTLTISGNVTIEMGTCSMTFNGTPALELVSGVTLPAAISELAPFDAMVELSGGSTVYYNTIDQALRSYSAVKLARDVSVSDAITLSSSRSIDFNGYDLISSADEAFALTGYLSPTKVTVSFTNSGEDESVITGGINIVSQNYTFTFNLGENVKVLDNGPLFLQGNGSGSCITVNIYGSLAVDVASGENEYAAIQGNGQAQYAGTVINIYESALVDGNGNSAAIYHPQNGVLNVYGGTVTGETGIYMKAGSLNISGGTISGTGAKADYRYNGNGFYSTGDALVVDNCIYPGGAPVVNITGGDFSSINADPVGSYKMSDDTTQSGGPENTVTGFIKGGSFSKMPDQVLLADGYECKESGGKYIVTASTVPVSGISLSQTELTLAIGGTATLKATVLPTNATNPAVAWASSDKAVATVDNSGNVTAVGVGETTITVTSVADPTKSATCKVTVTYADVTSVTLDKETLDLTKGETAALKATVLPATANQTVTWSSSNEGVATVNDSGEVTAVGVGEATITATAGDKEATCTVTVSYAEVTGITLDVTELTLVKDGTTTLTAKVEPASADQSVTWTSSDESIATVNSSGNVTAVGVGTATITATAVGGLTAKCEVTVIAPGDVIASVEPSQTDVSGIDKVDQSTATSVAGSVAADTAITDAAQSAANELDRDPVTQGQLKQEAEKQGLTAEEGQPINLFTQTFLNIEATALSKDDKDVISSITLNITPMVRIVASTASSPTDIKLEDNGVKKNAVEVKPATELTITAMAAITVRLPDSFANKTAYVEHKASNGNTYFYQATYDSATGKHTFTSYHGFSPFTFSLENGAVAEVNGIGYASLQAAVNAASNKDTITLNQSNGEKFSVQRSITFTVDKNGKDFTGTISAGTGYEMTKTEQQDGTVVYTFTRISTGGSGSSGASGDYIISVDKTTGGKVTVNPGRADKGDEVTITAVPNDGYELSSLTVTDKDGDTVRVSDEGNNKYIFTMPGGAVTVKAVFAPEGSAVVTPEVSFTDVAESFWAYNEIRWAAENGYMTGTTATTFNAGGTVTRQQVWMILARMSGARPADMAAAKAWAVNNGISDGTNPGGAVTRQQLVALLYRFAGQYGYDVSAKADLSGYPDVASLASYAADAMAWSVANGIIGGTTAGTLNPAGTATRAQFAAILWRFYQTTAI